MILVAFAIPGGTVPVGLAVLWLGAGTAIAAALARRGHGAGTAAASLVAWPLLLPLLEGPGAGTRSGPLAERVHDAFDALETALAEPEVATAAGALDLVGLRAAVLGADRRLGAVDRLLAQVPDTDAAHALRQARSTAASEIEGVLAGVLQLHLQLGLLTLAGDTRAVQGRIVELVDRVAALEEISNLAPPSP